MKLTAVTPILRIFDEAKTHEFYVDFLGFTIDWQHRFEPDLPVYMQVTRDACVLHLSAHHGDSSPGVALRIDVDDVDALQAELIAKRYGFARPGVVAQPWGTRDMAIFDPFGNQLVFTTPTPGAPD